ncbi:phage tail tape measure protein [Limosilactobacillus pontis]|uniref:Phage tail tape measure protein n=1 Tax=Limosilactobacillus pontis TaxID=35787 RepID=A0ABT7UWT4_9LACO|nr:phage tail tape measure protein [Limosilactobacillus pontis]MDM8266171.1 phage tail tape measure protein [Limosilactobacillus pontis]
MAKELSIKVKVDLPTAGDLESKLNKMLGGKDLNANVKVNAKIGKLGNLKSQIRRAIGNEKFNARVGVKVSGMGELNRLASQIEKVRRLASEPIKMKVDTGGTGFDQQIDEARAKAKDMGETIAKSQSSAMVAAQKEMRQAQNEMARTYAEMQRSEARAIKAKSDADTQVYKQSQERYKRQLEEQKANYRKMASGYGVEPDQIKNDISKALNNTKVDQSVALAKNAQKAREAAAAWKEYSSAVKMAYRAESRVATKQAGNNELAALNKQVAAYKAKAQAIKEANQEIFASGRYSQRAAKLDESYNRNIALIRAKQMDGAYSRGSKARGNGIMNTMNVWDMLQQGVYGASAAVAAINQVDKAITKVTKVVPDSQVAVNKWKKNIYRDAAEVGKTAPEFASAVEQWATAGYNLKQSNKLAKASVMGSFVGEVPVNDMVRYMSVPLKAFNKEGLKSKDIINSMNQVSNKHAIEMDDLGQAYQKASSTMAATGTTFSQMTGIITAAQEGTRAGGDAIGTAFKTISANLAQIGSGLTGQAKNKDKFFNGLGVQLKDSKGNLKSTYQIMDQLSKKWKTMSKSEKNTAALYAGGKNHANIFAATMDNWDTAKKAMAESQAQVNLRDKDHGSAYQEFAKQKQSIQFQLAGLQDTWMNFLQNITGGREGIGQILQMLNGLGQVAVKISSNKGLSQMVRWGAITAGIVMARRATTQLMGSLMKIGSSGSGIEGLKSRFSAVNESVSQLKDNVNELKAALRGVDSSLDKDKNLRKKSSNEVKKDEKKLSKAKEVEATAANSPYYYSLSGGAARADEKVRSKKYVLNKQKSSVGQNIKRAGNDALQTATSLIPALGRTEEKLNDVSNATGKGVAVTTKLSKAWGVAKGVMGVVGSTLGVVGMGIDAVTIASGVLEIAGVHPWQLIQRAINPATYNAQQFSKQMSAIHQSLGKVDSSLDSNIMFNGTASRSSRGLNGLNKTLSGVAKGVNQLSSADWKKFKTNFDSISKANGLGIRASANNVELLKGQMVDLKDALHDVNFKNFRSGVTALSKMNKEGQKLSWQKNVGKLVRSMKGYNSEMGELKAKAFDSSSIDYGGADNYRARERAIYNKYARKARNTDQYQEWAQNYEDYGAMVRKRYGALAKSLNSGTFTSGDYRRMTNNQLKQAATAQTINLQQAARASKIWNDVNGLLKGNNKYAAQQGKLTREQQQWLAKNVRGLEGISKNTQKWSDAQRQAFDKYGETAAKRLKTQQNRARDILEAEGVSKASANKQIKKLDGTGLGYVNALAGNSNAQQLLNVDADFASLYGKHWYSQLQRQQKQVQNYTNKHPNSAAIQAFVDPDTGVLNTGYVSRATDVMTQSKKVTRKFRGLGMIDKNGNLNYAQIADNFAGVKGASDPLSLMSSIADGTINKKSALHIAANASNGKFTSSVRKAIGDLVNDKGRADAKQYLDYLKKTGAIDGKTAKKAKDYVDKDLTARGKVKRSSKYYPESQSSRKRGSKSNESDYDKANKYWKERNKENGGKTKFQKWWDGLFSKKRNTGNSSKKSADMKQQSVIPTNFKNLGGKGSAFYAATHSKLGQQISQGVKGLFKKNGLFGKIGSGFSKGGIFGGLGNLGKMGLGGLGKLTKFGFNGAGKLLFGKNFKMPDFSKMFRGLNKIKLPNLNKALGGLKKIKMPNFSKMFKGLNKIKMPNFKKMFGGMKNPFDKLFGKNGGKAHKVKLQADTKGLSKSISKIGKGKGTKVKLQADTKALSKSISRLGKGKGQKVKLQADTKALSKSLSNLGKGKGQKIKLQADTKALGKSISNIGKGKKAKIKVTADTSGAKSKIKSLESSVKSLGRGNHKIKVTADTSGAKSKINSLKSAVKSLGNGTHKIRVTCSVSGQGKIKSLKSAINGLHGKSVNVRANASGVGKVQALKSAINGIHGKKVSVSAHVSGTGRVNALKSAINGVHSKHVSVSAHVSGIGQVRALASAIAAVHSKSVTVSATKVETTIKKTKSGSVAIDPQQAMQPVNPLTSMSVVAGNPSLAQALDASAANMGVDVNSAMNGQKVTDYSDSTQKVSEDYWRYMGNQLYTGLPLDEQVNKLESAVTQADDNMDKLITLSRQRIDVDRKQISYQETMQRAYQQQVTDMINQLHAYGFQNNGNQITNLDHAKSITGDNASKVDDLLSKYQSAYQNMSEAAQKIEELRTDIWQQGKNQEDYRNNKDQKMVDQLQRELEILTTSIDNSKNILERQADSLSDGDYVMKMKNGAEQINDKTEAVYQLLQKFNRLSVANFVGTKDADNAKNLLESLQSIRDSVTENLDSIDELKKSMRDTTLNSIIENLDKYTTNLSDSIDRLKNNVENLQDGLLSGTTYSDLMSSNFDVVNLHQKSAYEESVNERIDLEKAMDDALDRFAQKNVDRTAQVANQELQINQQKYDSLYRMAEGYANGRLQKIEPIRVKYEKQTETDQIDLPGVSHNQEYVKASTEYQKQMADLKARYNDEMSKATSQEEREAINQRIVYEQLSLQEATNKRMIEADKQAIEDLKKQAQDPGMSTEQLTTISDKIAEYEKNIIDAQNDIKDAVKSRFEYEKTQLDKEMDDYQRLSDTMSNLATIADALHLDGKTQAAVIDQQYAATYMQYDNYLNVLERLRNEMSKYEKGSFESNQLQDMINDYQSSLDGIVTSLLDITKSEFEQTLDSVQKSFEKSVNKGMTADQAKFDQDVWYNPMQKELKLEEMRLKITELEDKTVEKRIAALDAQERMSKAEADYVDKQLDLALAEQKLNNTINKKDVRYLEKDENGKFNWTYIADQDQVDAARQEVNQAKQAIEDAKVSNRNDYIEKVEEIVSDMKDGSINQEEVRSRLEQLNNSYKFILKDIPSFDISKVEDIIKAYDEYAEKNQNIIKDYQRSANVQNRAAYQDIVKGFGDQFKAVSKDLGEIFGKQLRETLNLPNGIRNAYGTGKDQSLVINGGLHIELPDVKDVDDFAKAIETLPQVAKQYATRK